MNITTQRLKQIIKEELTSLQQEGFLDMFKKKEKYVRNFDSLKNITMEDIMARAGRETASLYQADSAANLRKKFEQDHVDPLVQKMVDDPRRGGPRDSFERAVRNLGDKLRSMLR